MNIRRNLIQICLLAVVLLALPAVVQAQFTYTTNADGITLTITGFSGTPSVGPVNIPANINGLTVVSIGDDAFAGQVIDQYPNLVFIFPDQYPTSVTIPDSVTNIGQGAFYLCENLTNVTTLGGTTSIGDNAFGNCTSLTNVTIPDSVTSIGDDAFEYCTSLTNITIPGSVTSIGYGAFEYCTSLTSATIANGVTSIGENMFGECWSLTNVTISSSVSSIGEQAFLHCITLTSITIPGSVTNCGPGAFYACYDLQSVYFQGNAPVGDSLEFADDTNVVVYYLPGTMDWSDFSAETGVPTAPWFLPNPQILNHGPGFGVQPGGFGFTISWATNASVVVEAATNLANPVWLPVSTSPLTDGTNYFSDPQWTNYPERFYRATSAFTVGGTLTGLPAGDTVTLQDNGSDNLTLGGNGTFTFPTALPNGHAYSITVSGIFFGGLTPTTCTLTNGSGTISGANVTNVAAQCAYTGDCPPLTGNMDVDMLNAAVSDGTAHGGVPGVMLTENGGPFRVTALGSCSHAVLLRYAGYQGGCTITTIMGTTSCSSTTFPVGTEVIQFGTALACQPDDLYGY